MRFMDKLRRNASAWKRDERGVVAIIVAISLAGFIGLMGAGIDYSTSVLARSKTQAAGDAAALRALETLRKLMDQGQTYEQASPTATLYAQRAFDAQLGQAQFGHAQAPTITLVRDTATNQVTVTVNTSGYTDTSFMKVLGINSQSYSSSSKASTYLKLYINLVFLLDTSQSMGIMGDQTSINASLADSNMNCQFACHDSGEMQKSTATWPRWPGVRSDNLWNYARCGGSSGTMNLKLRIDFLREAIAAMLAKASASRNFYTSTLLLYGTPSTPTVLRPGGPTVTENCFNGKSPITHATYDTNYTPSQADLKNGSLANAIALTPLIDIEDNTFIVQQMQDPARTRFSSLINNPNNVLTGLSQTAGAMAWLQDNLPSGGDGLSAASPIQVVVLISDGTQTKNWGPGEYISEKPLDPVASCVGLKAKPAKLMVLYTTYLDVSNPTTPTYQERVQPIASQIGPMMQECATPTLFAEATHGTEFTAALTGLFSTFEKSLIIGLTQ